MTNSLGLAYLFPKLKLEASSILAKQPVMLAYLHGSVVDGTTLPSSDVDIALVLSPDVTLTAYERMLLEFEIAEKIEKQCGIAEADVRSIDQIPITIQGRITTEGKLIYSRDEEFRVEYEVYARTRYFDYLPVERMMRKEFFEHIREEGLNYGDT